MATFDDAYFMRRALVEAQYAFDLGEVPVGCVLVFDNRIIAKGYNQTEQLTDVTAHAEMIGITAGANAISAKYLNQCTLFVTLEPCIMCAGALYWSQIGRVVFGASDKKRGFRNQQIKLHPKTNITSGVLAEECQKILDDFFIKLRE